MIRKCVLCNKEYDGRSKYCSRYCKNEYQRLKKLPESGIRKCKYCSKEYNYIKGQLNWQYNGTIGKSTNSSRSDFYCSYKCGRLHRNNIVKNTCNRKYGVNFNFQLDKVKESIKNTFNKKYGCHAAASKEIRSKIEKTCLERYGNICSLSGNTKLSKIAQKKRDNTFNKKYGGNPLASKEIRSKIEKTCLERYGNIIPYSYNSKLFLENIKKKYNFDGDIKNCWNIPEIYAKVKKTCLERYGYENPIKNDKIKNKINWIEQQRKSYNTKKKNNTFKVSRIESKIFISLKEKYNNVIRQYKDDRYPFACDFYIPELDLFIECNFSWTHGGRQYIEDNEECIEKLSIWLKKSTELNFKNKLKLYYNNAIHTWTIRDVNKRNIAKENNLNYIEFFNIEEFNKWIENENI